MCNASQSKGLESIDSYGNDINKNKQIVNNSFYANDIIHAIYSMYACSLTCSHLFFGNRYIQLKNYAKLKWYGIFSVCEHIAFTRQKITSAQLFCGNDNARGA